MKKILFSSIFAGIFVLFAATQIHANEPKIESKITSKSEAVSKLALSVNSESKATSEPNGEGKKATQPKSESKAAIKLAMNIKSENTNDLKKG